MTHLVILPYYCEEEVRRFLKIISLIKHLPKSPVKYEFLLVTRKKTMSDPGLYQLCQSLANTYMFECPTNQKGHQQGSLAMFWDTMTFINYEFENDGGFAIWFESDMCFCKPNWLIRLSAEWTSKPKLLVMGKYLTNRGNGTLPEHVNGGACYKKNLVEFIPGPEGRQAPFDVGVFKKIKKYGNEYWQASPQFEFGTKQTISSQILNPKVAIAHGLAQPKNSFIHSATLGMRQLLDICKTVELP